MTRLDQHLVEQGLAPSRARAQALIKEGAVTVDGAIAQKPSQRAVGDIVVTADPNPWVSRAALKLELALDHFALVPSGMALDLGASTGGFTQVLLARGAGHVHALDVGHGQIHSSLTDDPRVTVHEGVNARALPPGLIPPLDWIVTDVSFISLDKALPPALALALPGAHLVALIKPQFEAGPAHVGKGGIVRDPAIHAEVCERVRSWLDGLGWRIIGVTGSPITGSDGNHEFLISARWPG